MKIKMSALALGALSGAAAAGALGLSAQTPKSQWDAIYSEAQAKRGDAVYVEKCAVCHGDDMGGKDDASPLTGREFSENWNELPIGALFERIRATMPQASPGSLDRKQVADLIAAILKKNGYPAGGADLPDEADALSAIQFLREQPR